MVYKYSDTLHDFLECCQDEHTKQKLLNMINIWDLAVKLYISPETSKKENIYSLVEWLTIFDPIGNCCSYLVMERIMTY
jgi:hypothetical protein